ncbi:MAG: helix-turn-helix domain-containing protein [Proteobacteria bacterium]|nr:helix-turn-helix domain-containing protein [Pseudomonadota bacterium]
MLPQLMNIKECSERLRVPIGTLRNWCSQKMIPYLKVNGRCLFDPREIERWLEGSVHREEDPNDYRFSRRGARVTHPATKGRTPFARAEVKIKNPQDMRDPKGRER